MAIFFWATGFALITCFFFNCLRIILPLKINGTCSVNGSLPFLEKIHQYLILVRQSKSRPIFWLLWLGMTYLYLWYFGDDPLVIPAILFVYISLTLLYIDLDTLLLPDMLTLPLLWAGLLVNLSFADTFISPKEAIYGVVFSYLGLIIFNFFYQLFRGVEGMGYGDVKLISAFGAWFGEDVLLIIALAFLLQIAGIMLLGRGDAPNQERPFGPALVISANTYLWWALLL
jgi:leader peptidase (prepilin peptidase)/N-methyltransferase